MNVPSSTLTVESGAVSPVGPHPAKVTLTLTGMLRRRGAGLYLDEQTDQPTAHGSGWSIPRTYRLMATPATQDAVRRLVDTSVTVAGNPDDIDEHGAKCVVLTSVEPSNRVPLAA